MLTKIKPEADRTLPNSARCVSRAVAISDNKRDCCGITRAPGNAPAGIFLVLMLLVAIAKIVTAADFAAQASCPVCKIDFPTIIAATETCPLAIDGQPLNTRFLPLPECPLCGGVFGDITLNKQDLHKLESFIWTPEQQNDRKVDTRLRFVKLLEQLERDGRQIGQAYLQTAWANSENVEMARKCREKGLKFFREYLDSPKAEEENKFDVSLKIADILRQLKRFREAEIWLQQMQTNRNFQQAWYPMLINHTLDLVRARIDKPATLPTGNRLHNAIAANDLKTIKILLSEKKLLSEIDTAGLTPLLLAVNTDNNTAAQLLIEAGAEPAQTDIRGNSPLHLAAQRNNHQLVNLLLKHGINPDPVNQLGQTPLHVAIETLNPQIAEILVNAGASTSRKDSRGNNMLHMVCQHSNSYYENFLEIMLKKIADVNQRNHDSMTPLHIAAINGNARMLKLLVQAGARIDARTPDGNSALFFCKPELTTTLIELGADIELKNNAGQSAFVYARLNVDKPKIDAFKKTGRFGKPAKSYKLLQDSVNIFKLASTDNTSLKLILSQNKDLLNAKELTLGETPLHFAAANGQNENVKLLLEKGADINITNDFLRTPLHYACVMGHFDVVKLLCQSHANIHALDARGATPLHDAAAAGHRKVYDYLIQMGASDSTLDNQGRSAAFLLKNYED